MNSRGAGEPTDLPGKPGTLSGCEVATPSCETKTLELLPAPIVSRHHAPLLQFILPHRQAQRGSRDTYIMASFFLFPRERSLIVASFFVLEFSSIDLGVKIKFENIEDCERTLFQEEETLILRVLKKGKVNNDSKEKIDLRDASIVTTLTKLKSFAFGEV
ncbi:hypothetical protein KSP40_PGU002750 [Platanthera guangdongensis]|uniref:Uncharacterized protein n=1 Tax=Platanthera guangdongensis TaxID=2320717 RepID=A0ABR2LRT8_9ASPA